MMKKLLGMGLSNDSELPDGRRGRSDTGRRRGTRKKTKKSVTKGNVI